LKGVFILLKYDVAFINIFWKCSDLFAMLVRT
jgi:hypothetical protein